MRFIVFLFFILALCGGQAFAKTESDHYHGVPQWTEFRQFMREQEAQDETLGLSYMISGSIAAVGGVIGYDRAEDPLSRSVYAITSTVGLAAIGLGASYYWAGNDYSSFYYAIEGSGVSLQERNRILQRYMEKEKEIRETRKWIRVVTHALIATTNFYSACHEKNTEVKPVFVFLGLANAVLAVSYTF